MTRSCLKVGLTGGIGSGKTTVSDLFARLGVPVIDADVISRDLLKPGTDTTRDVIETFGQEVAGGADSVDRAKLRQLVFDNPPARNRLEAIIHPRVREEIRNQVSALTEPYCIVVIPLLFESGQQDLVDRVLVVDASIEQQRKRASTRDNADDIDKIIQSQISREQRLARADDVLENTGDTKSLEQKVSELDQRYRSLATAPGNN